MRERLMFIGMLRSGWGGWVRYGTWSVDNVTNKMSMVERETRDDADVGGFMAR